MLCFFQAGVFFGLVLTDLIKFVTRSHHYDYATKRLQTAFKGRYTF